MVWKEDEMPQLLMSWAKTRGTGFRQLAEEQAKGRKERVLDHVYLFDASSENVASSGHYTGGGSVCC